VGSTCDTATPGTTPPLPFHDPSTLEHNCFVSTSTNDRTRDTTDTLEHNCFVYASFSSHELTPDAPAVTDAPHVLPNNAAELVPCSPLRMEQARSRPSNRRVTFALPDGEPQLSATKTYNNNNTNNNNKNNNTNNTGRAGWRRRPAPPNRLTPPKATTASMAQPPARVPAPTIAAAAVTPLQRSFRDVLMLRKPTAVSTASDPSTRAAPQPAAPAPETTFVFPTTKAEGRPRPDVPVHGPGARQDTRYQEPRQSQQQPRAPRTADRGGSRGGTTADRGRSRSAAAPNRRNDQQRHRSSTRPANGAGAAGATRPPSDPICWRWLANMCVHDEQTCTRLHRCEDPEAARIERGINSGDPNPRPVDTFVYRPPEGAPGGNGTDSFQAVADFRTLQDLDDRLAWRLSRFLSSAYTHVDAFINKKFALSRGIVASVTKAARALGPHHRQRALDNLLLCPRLDCCNIAVSFEDARQHAYQNPACRPFVHQLAEDQRARAAAYPANPGRLCSTTAAVALIGSVSQRRDHVPCSPQAMESLEALENMLIRPSCSRTELFARHCGTTDVTNATLALVKVAKTFYDIGLLPQGHLWEGTVHQALGCPHAGQLVGRTTYHTATEAPTQRPSTPPTPRHRPSSARRAANP
jgi:hypothetical protein